MHPNFAGLTWITPYGLMLVLALAGAWWWARRRAERRAIDGSHIDLLIPLAFLVDVVGARFLTRLLPADALTIGAGYETHFRLQLYGLLVAALPVVLIYARRMGLSTRGLLDVLALPALLWVAVLRIGCLLAGCCWGDLLDPADQLVAVSSKFAVQVHTLPWLDSLLQPFAVSFPAHSFAWEQQHAAGLLPASAAVALPVHPAQLYESGGVFALLLVLARLENRTWPPGFASVAALGSYAILRFAIEFVRADNALVLWSLTINQLLSLALLLFCVAGGLALGRWGSGTSRPLQQSNQKLMGIAR